MSSELYMTSLGALTTEQITQLSNSGWLSQRCENPVADFHAHKALMKSAYFLPSGYGVFSVGTLKRPTRPSTQGATLPDQAD